MPTFQALINSPYSARITLKLGLLENIKPKDLVKRKIKIIEYNKRINWVEIYKELTKRFIEYSGWLTIKEIKGIKLIKVFKYYNIKRDHFHKKLPFLYKEFNKVKSIYNFNNLDDECCSIINKLVYELYFKN